MVSAGERRFLRAPRPIHFPVEAEVPESKRHLEQRTALYQILKLAFRERALIGCDQFVYWDPTDPTACLAPDAFVRLGGPDEAFRSWKVWERGAPHVAVEVISDVDETDRPWEKKLAKYRRLGVQELVRFDPEDVDAPLRVWEQVSGDLVEREVRQQRTPCGPLGLFWVVVPHPELGPMLRLARDERGADLLPTPEEAAREAAQAERDAALARVRELEAELAKRR